MAKKHKNLENIKIQWNGDLAHKDAGNKNSNIPANVDLGKWYGKYTTVWESSGCTADDTSKCASGTMDDPVYFEDYNIWNSTVNQYAYNVDADSVLDGIDAVIWGVILGRTDIQAEINAFVSSGEYPDKAPDSLYDGRTPHTWGDVSFVIEIADGIGTGSRKARQARLDEFDDFKKKKLVRLICRVKGEKVYDEEKEVGGIHIKLEDAELVINEVLGKIKVENVDVL
jgi:hypothetical protein